MINPIAITNLFGIEGLNIHWYGIILCTGLILGVLLGMHQAKVKGYNKDMVLDFMLIAVPLSIVCARIYYVAFEWQRFAANPAKIFAVWEGGIAIYGAVIGGLIAAVIFCKWRKIRLGELLDIAAAPLILGQAIGRWGNFVNQEAFGNVITNKAMQWFPYGVYIQDLNEWHQATFFYESIWNFLVFGLLLFYFKRAKHRGNVFVMYLVAYGLGRAFIEGLRTDSLWLVPGVIRVSQLLSILLVVGGIIYLCVMHKKPVAIKEYTGIYSLKKQKDKAEAKTQTPEETQKTDKP